MASLNLDNTLLAAKQLLGWEIVRAIDGVELSGVITETEAYKQNDAASHSYKGQTKRNLSMFGPAGSAYVYKIYGIHNCFNIVTNKPGIGEAVLVRAIYPVEGVQLMIKNRKLDKNSLVHLSDGPGKLTQALSIDTSLNGINLFKSKELFIRPKLTPKRIQKSIRIGISKNVDKLWRFMINPQEVKQNLSAYDNIKPKEEYKWTLSQKNLKSS